MGFPRKLGPDAVRDIRTWAALPWQERDATWQEKARQHNVSDETVRRIMLGHCYKTVRA